MALDDRYEPARAFVLHGTPIGTELWIAASRPHPQLSTWWLPGEHGTAVALDIFGVLFVFNLEPYPLSAEVPQGVIRFTLRQETGDG